MLTDVPPMRTATALVWRPGCASRGTLTSTHTRRFCPAGTVMPNGLRCVPVSGSTAGIRASATRHSASLVQVPSAARGICGSSPLLSVVSRTHSAR